MDRPPRSALYDWSMAIAALWLSGGIMLDDWYHFHATVETFFEPAHALLYAGLFATFAFTGIAALAGRRRGYAWRNALPQGYGVTVLGLAVFLAGGLADMVKHSLWGFEQAFDALLSPTHLAIGAGMFLTMAGPICAFFVRRDRPRTLREQLPLVLCAASMMELIHWGTQFIFLSQAERMDAPVVWYSTAHWTLTLLTLLYDKEGLGLLAVIVQSLLLAGFLIYFARRVRLAFGSVTVLFVVGNVFIAAAQSNYVPQFAAVVVASAAAGLAADAFQLWPGNQSSRRWAVAGFCVPALYWSVLLAMLAGTMDGIWWSPDVIAGSILFAGLAGIAANALAGPFPATEADAG